jgi:hypothetical protein
MTANFHKFLLALLVLLIAMPAYSAPGEYVVLLHGLVRTNNSMNDMEKNLSSQGYVVLNIDYPSRKYEIPELAAMVREEIISKTPDAVKIHFITHSMGGIILRYIQKNNPLPNLGRVVMLSPPNHGSELADKFGNIKLFEWIVGPAGKQLGTDNKSVCRELGKADFELGVITGDESLYWINSSIIPGEDDGTVSVESAKLEGMADFLVVHTTHPFIMNNKMVMKQSVHFLQNGTFDKRE